MKKTPRKLVLHRETLRTLANADLVRAVGGFETGEKQCPAVLDTGDKACQTATDAGVITTAACR